MSGSPQFDNEMAEILESFIIESNEILENLGQDLIGLERNPADTELHNRIFRAVHTVKGTSSFLGFEQMTKLAHRFEDVLNKIRRNELRVTSGGMDVMFRAYDLLKLLLQRIEQKNTDPIDIEAVLHELEQVNQGNPPERSEPQPELPKQPDLPVIEQVQQAAPAASHDEDSVPAAAEAQQASSSQSNKTTESTIRVDVARLDTLMNLVGELVLGRNRLSQIAGKVAEQHENLPVAKELADTGSQIDLITTELQMAVMKTRMVPIAKVFNKLPRLMRELSKEMGKEITLTMSGEETELDKSIIEELNDPLIHLLRNASDHGIEGVEERKKHGKPEAGSVSVMARHEGSHIVISVSDDGRGMDPEKLKQKAMEKGLITESRAREMSKREAFELIFAPGFSTAAAVTNISGRGVGMDVVRTNITRLKGIIEIDSEQGKGTTILLKLPLTLAIIQGLLGEVHNEIYCVPLSSVIEVVRVKTADIATINGKEVIRLRDTVLPLARLATVFNAAHRESQEDWIYVIVLGLAEQRLGVVVDSLLGQREVVIKSLGGYLGNVPGVAGSTILGDGRVIMILDVGQFMNLWRMRAAA